MQHSLVSYGKSVLRTAFAAAAPVVALLLCAASSPARADDDRDDFVLNVPASLQVPAGNVLSFAAHGRGVQIYAWSAASSTWVFKAPHALLFEDDAGVAGIHFAGPTWQNNDGSAVVGSKLASVTVDPTAVPWLLLKAAITTGPGVFAEVTFVQRLRTRGGLAPAAPGMVDGQEVLVPYSAEYLFYIAQ